MNGRKLSLEHYLDKLQAQGQYYFNRQEALATLEINASAFKYAARRLAAKQKLARVRGDFYILLPPEYRIIGSLPATWFIDSFMQHLNQIYYVALLSAASMHGAAHQQPMTFQVITDKPTRSIHLGQVTIDFFFKKQFAKDFSQAIKTPTGQMLVSTPEMTAYDLVQYMSQAGHIHHIATVLLELADQLQGSLLARLLAQKQVTTTAAQRLGYLLETLNCPVNLSELEAILQTHQPRKQLLVTQSSSSVVSYNPRWHIKVNEVLEPDEL